MSTKKPNIEEARQSEIMARMPEDPMPTGWTRRTVVKGLGVAAAVATAACNSDTDAPADKPADGPAVSASRTCPTTSSPPVPTAGWAAAR